MKFDKYFSHSSYLFSLLIHIYFSFIAFGVFASFKYFDFIRHYTIQHRKKCYIYSSSQWLWGTELFWRLNFSMNFPSLVSEYLLMCDASSLRSWQVTLDTIHRDKYLNITLQKEWTRISATLKAKFSYTETLNNFRYIWWNLRLRCLQHRCWWCTEIWNWKGCYLCDNSDKNPKMKILCV